MDETSFHLIGTNGLHVKTESEGFTAAGLHCQRLKFEKLTLPFAKLRQTNVLQRLKHVQQDDFSSFDQLHY